MTDADPYEKAAGGMDYDDDIRERATDFGSRLASEGPDALLEQVEEMIPEGVKDQVREFPIVALIVGAGIGVFLGLKKGDELIAAGSSLIAAAATANLNSALASKSEE